jgi:hypothetical protein
MGRGEQGLIGVASLGVGDVLVDHNTLEHARVLQLAAWDLLHLGVPAAAPRTSQCVVKSELLGCSSTGYLHVPGTSKAVIQQFHLTTAKGRGRGGGKEGGREVEQYGWGDGNGLLLPPSNPPPTHPPHPLRLSLLGSLLDVDLLLAVHLAADHHNGVQRKVHQQPPEAARSASSIDRICKSIER